MAAGVPSGTRVTYQLWFDRKHRPCKVTFRVGRVSVRAEFDEWGKPVHVVRPTPAQVVSGLGRRSARPRVVAPPLETGGPMRVRRRLAVIGVVAAMTALSACNGGGQANKAGDTHGSASSSSASAGSPSPSTSSAGHLDKAGLVKALTVGQTKAGSAHVAMRMTGATSLTAHGDVAYHGKDPQMRLTMSMPQLGNGRMELRFVGGILYLNIPKVTPAGKFIRVDPRDKSNPLGKSFGSLSGQMNPLNSFAAMKQGVRKVRYVGHQGIDGTPTDHYVVTVDSAALAKAMKQPQVTATLPRQLTYDMWLDQQDLLRRTRFRTQGLTTQMDLTRWGERVHVQAPPSSKVVDPSRLAS